MAHGTVRNWIDRHASGLAALAVAGAAFFYGDTLAIQFAKDGGPWSLSALYSGILGWASIECGFLFAAYTFVAAHSSAFIRAIARTPAFESFKELILHTVYVSLIVALATFVLSVINLYPTADAWISAGFALWYGLVALSIFRFLDILRTFAIIARTRAD